VCQLTVLLLLAGCELERQQPASPGSSSANGAAMAGEIEALSARIQERALAIQAASDPEALAAGGPSPDLALIRAELEQLRAQREALASKLAAMEQLAVGPVE
jgi:hypothetical protein